jgi:D-glycero-D-manno-heptose 1,7-bisphosphate phosphatase
VNKAVFLDRDGVINIEKDYVYKIEDFEFQEGVFEAVKEFNAKNYLVIVVTNQSGISRGYYTNDDFLALTEYMLNEFEKHGAKIAKVYHCPHAPTDECECRKPKPKMFLDAKKEFDIDMDSSWMIGDKEGDIEAANNAGINQTILVKSGHKIDEKNTKAALVVNGVFDTITLIK